MVQVGDRVVVSGWAQFQPRISRIYWEDGQGRETDIQALAVTVRLELEWDVNGERSKSKVHLHDENKTWYKYDKAS